MPGLDLGYDNMNSSRKRSGSVGGSHPSRRMDVDATRDDRGFGASTSSVSSRGSKNRTLPPPLAESTPKKKQSEQRGSISGADSVIVNGVLGASTNTISGLPAVNGINGTDPSPRKRKAVQLEDDDMDTDEDRGLGYMASPSAKLGGSVPGSNGFTLSKWKGGTFTPNGKVVNGVMGSPVSSIKFAQLQDQRKQLPIAKGTLNCFVLNISKRVRCLMISDHLILGKDALIREIKTSDTVVLLGETGSGKTTRKSKHAARTHTF